MPRDHATALVKTPPLNVRSIVDSSPSEALIGVCADKNAPVKVYEGFAAPTADEDGFKTSVVVVPTRL
jgi:hypothetical protein